MYNVNVNVNVHVDACTADLGTESADESAKNLMVGNAGQFGFLSFFSFFFVPGGCEHCPSKVSIQFIALHYLIYYAFACCSIL